MDNCENLKIKLENYQENIFELIGNLLIDNKYLLNLEINFEYLYI